MYRTVIGLDSRSSNLWNKGTIAASVLPTPVGAINRTLPPASISGHVEDWAKVGSERLRSSKALNNRGFNFIILSQLSYLILQIQVLQVFQL